MTSVLTDDISVWPSGLARATCWLPMLPLAPATLSTTTGWPSLADSLSATKRAMMSGPVPGVKGTTTRTGWSGQAKAAGAASDIPRRAAGRNVDSWAAFNQPARELVDTTYTCFTS